ncbi:TetR/AcrR family transcriptional regulator [Clostridium beijerinckii]|uniref:AcrR family transcriptional regulator n=1 Tax=Clostridium beijerinckii TaxID=1520 RepID=A0A0B5QS42_CLOBE|nr:TetR/AcrR family transcriptional regulator [Clostridium beijerinckii]AJH00893.1 TetR family transcriptional regulator [Clostridium beijerinckii]AQS06684.1 HTH-type transcriptional regulator BetI [Clostridium beijerinckii]MBA2887822.1 AcrR family transcriptional regulator [Clostridium beijerinckii]MBA2901664.1 AcrR family transcriptional regulator [Clostridium beijerinckii]MBA2911449.1 AcrR family transcriptional regulator [Clostridium beijerinckii]
MVSKFLNLDSEKQNRILNAAINEFAEKGYENASTNEIVKDAGISKGLLFHYFKNKKQLFLFLYDYCIDVSMTEFYKKIDLNERDFFVRLRQIHLIKAELLNKYPKMLKFIEVANMEKSSDIENDLNTINKEELESASKRVFDGIDLSKFRDGIDIEKAINVVIWSFQGFNAKVLEEAKLSSSKQINYDKAFIEAEAYTEMLKSCFYK